MQWGTRTSRLIFFYCEAFWCTTTLRFTFGRSQTSNDHLRSIAFGLNGLWWHGKQASADPRACRFFEELGPSQLQHSPMQHSRNIARWFIQMIRSPGWRVRSRLIRTHAFNYTVRGGSFLLLSQVVRLPCVCFSSRWLLSNRRFRPTRNFYAQCHLVRKPGSGHSFNFSSTPFSVVLGFCASLPARVDGGWCVAL